MTAPVVVDTNVVVAGLISGAADSPVCRILDAMLLGRLSFLLCAELLEEYRAVLLRPAVGKLHGLTAEQVDVILTDIVSNAMVREPEGQRTVKAPDRGDDHLWRLLATTPEAMLVSGDRRLLENPPSFAPVVSPRIFVDSHLPA